MRGIRCQDATQCFEHSGHQDVDLYILVGIGNALRHAVINFQL